MVTCKEKALEWGVSLRTVNHFCKQGKIPGAIKWKGSWQIPDEAKKPEDGRVSSGKYKTQNETEVLKSLPIGISRRYKQIFCRHQYLEMWRSISISPGKISRYFPHI